MIARLLGIPAANEEQLFAWVRGLFDYPFHPEAALRAREEVNAFLLPLIHARRAVPACGSHLAPRGGARSRGIA